MHAARLKRGREVVNRLIAERSEISKMAVLKNRAGASRRSWPAHHDRGEHRKRKLAEAKIEISLSRLGQLFNSFDPSPFTSAISIKTRKNISSDQPRRWR